MNHAPFSKIESKAFTIEDAESTEFIKLIRHSQYQRGNLKTLVTDSIMENAACSSSEVQACLVSVMPGQDRPVSMLLQISENQL